MLGEVVASASSRGLIKTNCQGRESERAITRTEKLLLVLRKLFPPCEMEQGRTNLNEPGELLFKDNLSMKIKL